MKKTQKHYSNFFGYIAHIFTSNIPLSILVLIFSIIVGFISYSLTPKQYNPEVIRPAFVISTEYPGATSYEVNQFITQSIVEDVQGIDGVEEVSSQSFDGGLSLVTAMFYVGENTEDAKTKLFTKISSNYDIQIPGVSEPSINSIDPDDVPIVTLYVSSPRYTQDKIRSEISKIINDFKKIEDVKEVQIYGGDTESLIVKLDRAKMEALDISISEVAYTINLYNKRVITQGIKNGNRIIGFEINNFFQKPEDAKALLIRDQVSLGDIASVYSGYEEKDSFVDFSRGEENTSGIFISFAKKKGSNAPSVSENIQKKTRQIIQEKFGSDIVVETLRDDGFVAEQEIKGLMLNLMISVLIVGIVLFLFLSIEPALIVMGTIPIILLLVFIPGYLVGETINRITLFALILSLGLLVDSATVVVENIYRQIKKHPEKTIQANTVRAVNQVGVGLLLSTITSVVVFFPIKYITGMMGPYMGPLAFFVPVALVISLVTALVITPFLAHSIFKRKNKKRINVKPLLDPLFEKLSIFYEQKLKGILKSKKKSKMILVGLLVVFVISLSFPLLRLVHFQMLPKADKDQVYVHIDLPYGSDILKTKTTTENIISRILENDSVESVQSFIGTAPIPDFNGLFKGVQNRNEAYQSTLRVNLIKERKRSSIDIAVDIRHSILALEGLPYDTSIKVLEDPPGPPVQATFVVEIYGPQASVREDILKTLKNELPFVKGLVDIDSSLEEAREHIILSVDQKKVQEFGVDMESFYPLLHMGVDTSLFSQYHNDGGEFSFIEVSFPREERMSIEDALDLEVPNSFGTTTSLSDFTTIRRTRNVPSLFQKDANTYDFISGEVEKKSIVYVVLDSFTLIKNITWKESFEVTQVSLNTIELVNQKGEVYSIVFDGEWNMSLENFRDLGIAMLAALLLVYAILVAQYKSFLVPALIMVTIPLGLVGILFGFTFLDISFNVYLTATALIGFIALIGIVVNNAILYLEYFTELIQENPDIDHSLALVEAGKVRLRPILLTSLTTILANLTIVSDPVWSGLGWAIIFGLSLSTVMTLIVFPILYIHFDAHKN